MRTIAVCNLKGGVAKTTTVINVAAVLAKDYKQQVLVIDADSQCNTTEFFGGGEPETSTLADLLRETRDGINGTVEEYIRGTTFPGVSLVAADDSLMDLDLTKVETNAVEVTVLRDVVAVLGEQDAFDWCLIDCPPAFNAASAAALLAADEVLIPIKLDAFSLRGMANLLRQIHNMREINPNLRLLGCLPTMWEGDNEDIKALEELGKAGLPVLYPIRYTRKAKDMTYAQEPLLVSSPRSAAGVDYRRLVRELVKGGKDNG